MYWLEVFGVVKSFFAATSRCISRLLGWVERFESNNLAPTARHALPTL